VKLCRAVSAWASTWKQSVDVDVGSSALPFADHTRERTARALDSRLPDVAHQVDELRQRDFGTTLGPN
jgi:hypothetical protein